MVPLLLTKLDTLPESSLISMQSIPYQAHDGTCFLVGLLLRIDPYLI
jgi:hypothetical protein